MEEECLVALGAVTKFWMQKHLQWGSTYPIYSAPAILYLNSIIKYCVCRDANYCKYVLLALLPAEGLTDGLCCTCSSCTPELLHNLRKRSLKLQGFNSHHWIRPAIVAFSKYLASLSQRHDIWEFTNLIINRHVYRYCIHGRCSSIRSSNSLVCTNLETKQMFCLSTTTQLY